MNWKASVSALQDLVDEMVAESYGAYSTPDAGDTVQGVRAIPARGTGSHEGVRITNHRMYRSLNRLDMEVWDLVQRYQRIMRRDR